MHSRKHVSAGYLPDMLERDPLQETVHKGHRQRVATAKAFIDNRPSTVARPSAGKTKLLADLRQQEIDRENQILLLKLNRILTTKSTDMSTAYVRKVGSRMSKNRRTAKEVVSGMVARENAALSRRIDNVTSTYSNKARKDADKRASNRIVPSKPGKLWAVKAGSGTGMLRQSMGSSRGGALRTLGKSTVSVPTLHERALHASEMSHKRRAAQMSGAPVDANTFVVPSLMAPTASTIGLDDDEAAFYDSSDMFLSREALAARKRAARTAAKGTNKFVGRDLVLGKRRVKVSDPNQVAAAKDKAAPGEAAEYPTESWDLNVVEVGHLTASHDDSMTALRVDGTRVSDGRAFSFELDLEMLKTVAQRHDKAAYMTLTQAKPRADPGTDLQVYTRLSQVPNPGKVSIGGRTDGHDVGEKHEFFLGKLVQFVLERIMLTDAGARVAGSLLAFNQRSLDM